MKSLGKRKLILYKENEDTVIEKKLKKEDDFILWYNNTIYAPTIEKTQIIIDLINKSKEYKIIEKIDILLKDSNIILNGGEIFDHVIMYGEYKVINYFLNKNEDISMKEISFDYFLKHQVKKYIKQNKINKITELIKKILYKETIYWLGDKSKEEVILNNYDYLKGLEIININSFYTLFFKWRDHCIFEKRNKTKKHRPIIEKIESTLNNNLKKIVQLMEIDALHTIFTKYIRDMSYFNYYDIGKKKSYQFKYSLFPREIIDNYPDLYHNNKRGLQSSCIHTYYDYIEDIVTFMPYMFVKSNNSYMINFQNRFTEKILNEKYGLEYEDKKKKLNVKIEFKHLMIDKIKDKEKKKYDYSYQISKKEKFRTIYLNIKKYKFFNDYLFLFILKNRVQNKIKKEVKIKNINLNIFNCVFHNHFEKITSYL